MMKLSYKKEYDECLEKGHVWQENKHSAFECGHCKHFSLHGDGRPYYDELYHSAVKTMTEILENPFTKKLYNYLRNDLTGIVNRINTQYYSFDFNDYFISEPFLQEFTKILKSYNFSEQQFNKKALKEAFVEFFTSHVDDIVVGVKQEGFFDFWPINDRELRLITYVHINYDENNS